VVRISHPNPIRLKLVFEIFNYIRDSEIITAEVAFATDSPAYTILTPLMSDDLLEPSKGWMSQDQIGLEIIITCPDTPVSAPESRAMLGPLGGFRAQWTTRNPTCLTTLPGTSRGCGHLRHVTLGATRD
jgi:hypothetical protein